MHIEQGTSMAAASADRRRWLVLAIVTSGGFIAVLDAFIVNVAIPSIQHGLHASSGEIEFVIAAYTLSYAVLLITGGRLGDIYGRKRMFMLGMGAFTVASAGCGLAPTATVLILCRALQGVGAAVMYPQVLSIIQVTFADQSRNVALGIFAGSIGVASIAGQLVGGVLIGADLFGMAWRPVFLVNIPIGVLAILASAVVLRHRRAERPPSLDLFGVVLATAFLLLLLVPLVEGRDAGWPWWTAASLGLSAPALVLFIRYERRREARDASPLISVRLFRLRSVSAGVLVALCFFGGNAGLFFTLAVCLQTGLGFTPLAAGLTFLPIGVAFVGASLAAPRLIPVLGRRLLRVGFALDAAGLLATGVIVHAAGSTLRGPQLIPALAVAGAGQGLAMAPLVSTVLTGVRRQDVGAASGVMSTSIQLGNSLGVAFLGLVFFSILGSGVVRGATRPGSYADAFALTLIADAALALVGFLLVALLPQYRRPAATPVLLLTPDVHDATLERR